MARFLILLSFFGLVLASPVPAYALGGGGGPNAQSGDDAPDLPETCDTEVWDVMKTKAWMEGKREMEVNQTLILKPDSVLEYSCFAVQVAIMNQAADFLFGDNLINPLVFDQPVIVPMVGALPNPPSRVGGLTPLTLDNMMNPVVGDTNIKYQGFNFWHSSAGGTGQLMPLCTSMSAVWDFLRCQDFGQGNVTDFIKFDNIEKKDNDPRRKISDSLLKCDEPNRERKWKDAKKVQNPVPSIPPAKGGVETELTYLNKLNPASCGAMVKTGLKVKIRNQQGQDTEKEDAVCVAPGCSYNGSSCQ